MDGDFGGISGPSRLLVAWLNFVQHKPTRDCQGRFGSGESEGAGKAQHGSSPRLCAGVWDGEASGLLKQEKETSLTFSSTLTSPLELFWTPGLMEREADPIALLGCAAGAELRMHR